MDTPDEYLAWLEGAQAMHKMYKGFVDGGFTQDEALTLVVKIMMSGPPQGSSSDRPNT